ncbi:hypothetical protein [Vibrio cholerae]|uniref:hypothetical protein n=1 Tax=Vibrio cholerae TaxID=666 RepID=UPI00301810A5
MSDEMKMSDVEKNIRASAVMDFVDMIRGAYDSGFIDNHPTNYDIYRSAQMHVKDRYGVETDNWDDELAKESRNDNHDRLVEENKRMRDALEKIQRMQSRTPELPEDYTHEDVGDLNDRIDEVFGIVNTALSGLGGEKDAQLK